MEKTKLIVLIAALAIAVMTVMQAARDGSRPSCQTNAGVHLDGVNIARAYIR